MRQAPCPWGKRPAIVSLALIAVRLVKILSIEVNHPIFDKELFYPILNKEQFLTKLLLSNNAIVAQQS